MTERFLLSRKKQRALEEMSLILQYYLKEAKKTADHQREGVVQSILNLITAGDQTETVDLNVLAESWLDIIRPVWYKKINT